MSDRSWTDVGNSVMLPPHIRDALERAAQAQQQDKEQNPDPPSPEDPEMPALPDPPAMPDPSEPRKRARVEETDGDVVSLRVELQRATEKIGVGERRESALLQRLSQKDREAGELRSYCHDVLRLHEREHAYLRATHLDPAIGLEIELLKSKLAAAEKSKRETKPVDELAEDDAVKIATRKCEALEEEKKSLAITAANAETERDELQLRIHEMEAELSAAREWNDQLEDEREELYGMIDENRQAPTEAAAPDDDGSMEGIQGEPEADDDGAMEADVQAEPEAGGGSHKPSCKPRTKRARAEVPRFI